MNLTEKLYIGLIQQKLSIKRKATYADPFTRACLKAWYYDVIKAELYLIKRKNTVH